MSLTIQDFSKVLWNILIRKPILIIGSEKNVVDQIASLFSSLLPFRKEIIFWKSFTSKEELYSILEFEEHDPNSSRICIRCPAEVANIALSKFDDFDGWIIGTIDNNPQINEEFVIIRIDGNKLFLETQLKRNNYFEKLISNIIEKTRVSIEHVRRHLEKEIGKFDNFQIIEDVLSLNDEFKNIIHDLFDEAMQDFYHASRRAYFLLMKIKILRSLNYGIQIGKRNFIELIDVSENALNNILLFIESEWNENFDNCIRGNVLSNLGIYVESLWGT